MDTEEDLEETRRIIFAKLCKRLAAEHGFGQKHAGETKMFDRVLALWIDVQRAVLAVEKHERKMGGCCTPWNCPDALVSQAWAKLTEGRNLKALESLFCQLPDGPQRVLARKAVRAALRNSRGVDSK